MKLFRDKPLRLQATYAIAFVLFVLTCQLLLLVWRFTALDYTYRTADFVRKAQFNVQQITGLAGQQMQGRDITAELFTKIDSHDHQLKVLSEGGRLDDTKVIVSELSGLPRVTYDELVQHWNTYKKSLLSMANKPLSEAQQIRVHTMGTGIVNWYSQLINDLNDEIESKKTTLYLWLAFFFLMDLALLAFIRSLFIQKILEPLKILEDNTIQHINTQDSPNNEIGQVAVQVNEVLEQLKDASDFVETIGEGNLNMDYRQLDSNYAAGKNRLADSLIAMQTKLKALNEDEQKRKWANEGLARFVDILRTAENDIAILGDKIISALVKYTRSNQGGLYFLNDEDPDNRFLELISLFAFDIKKHEKQTVRLGEGILGQTFLEKESTYLLEIPKEYVRIRSGLGDANPKAILIVPLKLDNQVYGVVELASFNEFMPHEISFVEKLGETIASTLASVKAAQRNQKLLNESKIAAEAMRAQEEEMRQNMEELQATQEEMARKERDYVARIEQLEQQLKNQVSTAELEEARKARAEMQQEYEARIRQLNEQLSSKQSNVDNWTVVDEVEKALRINLEAIRITGEELRGNQ